MTATDLKDSKGKGNDDRGRQTLRVRVFAPRSPKPKAFEWARQMLVGAAAAEAAAAFGYTGGTPALSRDDRVLDPTLTLQRAGVKDRDKLELLDKGGGV